MKRLSLCHSKISNLILICDPQSYSLIEVFFAWGLNQNCTMSMALDYRSKEFECQDVLTLTMPLCHLCRQGSIMNYIVL